MSHRTATSARVIEIASRTDAGNPAFVEALRRKVQDGLPYGGGERSPALPFGEFVVDGPELLVIGALAVFVAGLLTLFLRLTRPSR